MKDRNSETEGIAVFPRSIARGMAKAEIGSNRLMNEDWRLAAAVRAEKYSNPKLRGIKYAKRSK